MTGAMWGSALYEFRMQIRRPAVWLVLLLLSGAAALSSPVSPWRLPPTVPTTPTSAAVAGWALVIQLLAPAAFGCLLADRLPRDRRLRVGELLGALPARPGARLAGKFLGATLATALPMLLVYAAGLAYVVAQRGGGAIAPGLLAFLAINVPGLLFVAAFSIGCPALMPVPMYQFLFVGYWFWGNLLSPVYRIPTISGTPLTPLGAYAARGLFGAPAFITRYVTAAQAAGSIALLLAGTALALWATSAWLSRAQVAG